MKNLAGKPAKVDLFVPAMNNTSIMDHGSTTFGNDLIFDALAMNYSRKKEQLR